MTWLGKWRNQYGSVVEITDDTDHEIRGTFRTALPDSGFHGKTIAISGRYQGDCIGFAGGGETAAGDAIFSFTGLLREGKMETLWYVVADAAVKADPGKPGRIEKLNWWRSMTTSHDTFERMP